MPSLSLARSSFPLRPVRSLPRTSSLEPLARNLGYHLPHPHRAGTQDIAQQAKVTALWVPALISHPHTPTTVELYPFASLSKKAVSSQARRNYTRSSLLASSSLLSKKAVFLASLVRKKNTGSSLRSSPEQDDISIYFYSYFLQQLKSFLFSQLKNNNSILTTL